MGGSPGTYVVVVGAGVGGLTTAALLLKAGLRVTVLEKQTYAGGSAGTFFHKGYRFDAGATLAGGFAPGGPHARVAEILGITWPVWPADPAWQVHLGGRAITQWHDPAQWQAERRDAFPGSESFWRLQEKLADLSWDISSRSFPWPPQSAEDAAALAAALRPRTLLAAPYLLSRMGSLLPRGAELLRAFVDAQLLISAQTTAAQANALYGSAALDLPRRGVNHIRGGIGGLSAALVDWIRANGGQVLFRQGVERIVVRGGKAVGVRTDRGLDLACDGVAANQTPWGLARLLGEQAPARLQREIQTRKPTWGAFTLYLGLEAAGLPAAGASHHQIVADPTRPLGEGNSVFLSISDPIDSSRAPLGMRAATLSTHTQVESWWRLAQEDSQAYQARKETLTATVLEAAEQAVPGLRAAVRLCLPGTPLTFERYTGRPLGMVGGFAQTSLLTARGPGSGVENLWLVGDSVFPGQSTAGVTLGALRVAALIQKRLDARR